MTETTKRPRGWLDDPARRHARAVTAGQAAKRAHQRRAVERAAGLSAPAAYVRGYRTGYALAYRYWRRWAAQQKERA